MIKQWTYRNINPKAQKMLSDALGIHPIVAQILINRGLSQPRQASMFLNAGLKDLHDPFLLKGMDRAVERIRRACRDKERILVFGDYDVDGVTSSALLNQVLTRMGAVVKHHIPHRIDEGYGLNMGAAETVKEKDIHLVVSVDCGITAVKEVDAIRQAGADVIIIDHHEPGDHRLPDAFAIVNPKQDGCPYPFKELASVGLVAKLIQALLGKFPEDLLDLVAIGTVADVVPLRDENRIFVKEGLPRISRTKNAGVRALLDVAKVNGKKLEPFHIGFIIGPRLNAAGRMGSALSSLDLLLSKETESALTLAKMLDKHNQDRQKLQKDVIAEAMDIVEQEINFKDTNVIVLGREGWHKGVLGIVASRLSDKYYRPSIVISLKDGVGTASCRSIDGFHLHDALSECSSHLVEFGGHEAAAGLTIKAENIELFRSAINAVASQVLAREALVPKVCIECDIPIDSISLDMAALINSMEPYGEGNPRPIFASRNVTVKSYGKVMGKETLKFWVQGKDRVISAIGFGMARFQPHIRPNAKIHLAYEIGIDDWNKAPEPLLKICDIQVCDA